MSWKPKTNGERLFILLRDQMLEASGRGHVRWSNLASLFEQASGRSEFGEYLRGAAAVHVMRRLLRFWEAERKLTPQESQYVVKVIGYIREEVLTALGEEATSRLARAVIAAETSCRQSISPGLRTRILKGSGQMQCYLCRAPLSATAREEQTDFLTLEHLWPQSMGGDSTEDNLLPSCRRCQDTTKDTLSWEWLNVHNIVLPVKPSPEAIASVSRRTHFARYYLAAMRLADDRGFSLKEAFNTLGPMRQPIIAAITGHPVTFFDLETTS